MTFYSSLIHGQLTPFKNFKWCAISWPALRGLIFQDDAALKIRPISEPDYLANFALFVALSQKPKYLEKKNSDIWINSCPPKTSPVQLKYVHIFNFVQVKLHHSVFIWTPAVCRPEKEKTPIQVIFIKIKIENHREYFFLPKSRLEKKSRIGKRSKLKINEVKHFRNMCVPL